RVGETDRETIDLQLCAVGDVVADRRAHAFVERADLRLVEGVLKAEHRRAMTHLRELLRCLATDALGWRVGRQEVGPRILDAPELEEQRVVLRVRNLRLVEHVVGVLVTSDQVAQVIDPDRRVDAFFSLAHFVSGASMPLRILRPALSNLTTSSSSVRVSVLLTTVPDPKAG